MKKIFLAALAGVTAMAASGQIIRSDASERTFAPVKPAAPVVKSWNHSGLFVNTGIGLLTGDADADFAWEAGWGYRWHIAAGVSWEVFRIGMNVGVSNFSETFDLRFTSGLRYDTPRFGFIGDRSFYATFCLGYGGLIGADAGGDGGFVYEVGAGIKLTRKCSVGLFYQGDREDSYYYDYRSGSDCDLKWGMLGVKIEYQFR